MMCRGKLGGGKWLTTRAAGTIMGVMHLYHDEEAEAMTEGKVGTYFNRIVRMKALSGSLNLP